MPRAKAESLEVLAENKPTFIISSEKISVFLFLLTKYENFDASRYIMTKYVISKVIAHYQLFNIA
jgi:hypothetical protein